VQKTHFFDIFEVMLLRSGRTTLFLRNPFVLTSIYIDEYAKLINLTISRKRKKIFERLKMDFEGK